MIAIPIQATPGVAAAALLVGVAITAWTLWHIRLGLAARRWPTAAGEIIGVTVRERTDLEAAQQFEAVVVYRYRGDGLPYRGEGARYGSGVLGATADWVAAKVSKRYPPGAAVRVYYDPKRPEVSVLEPGVSVITLLTLAVGLTFAAGGAAALFGGR
jgi:hypothetical protein